MSIKPKTMTAETFNEFGRQYGYPIYVFSDGTYASTRLYGKQVLFTVEGPIDTNPAHQRRLTSNQDKYPVSPCREVQKKNDFWTRTKQKINSFFEKPESEYTDFTEVKDTDLMHKQSPDFNPMPNTGSSGKLIRKGKDWSVVATGVKDAKIFHAKEADREVFVANFKF